MSLFLASLERSTPPTSGDSINSVTFLWLKAIFLWIISSLLPKSEIEDVWSASLCPLSILAYTICFFSGLFRTSIISYLFPKSIVNRWWAWLTSVKTTVSTMDVLQLSVLNTPSSSLCLCFLWEPSTLNIFMILGFIKCVAAFANISNLPFLLPCSARFCREHHEDGGCDSLLLET